MPIKSTAYNKQEVVCYKDYKHDACIQNAKALGLSQL